MMRISLVLLLAWMLTSGFSARAEQHRVTRLGNPATSFAPALVEPDELRARFEDETLRPDFIEVLRQGGWPGNPDDFFSAGLTNEIVEIEIPVGSFLPFIAARANDRPVCLRNVTWAGTEAISGYAFTFNSRGRIYRCIVLKPGTDFFVVDLGAVPQPALAIDCNVPEKNAANHPFEICLNVHNYGNVVETNVAVSLPIPDNAVITATTDGGAIVDNAVEWRIARLSVNATKQICARINPRVGGLMNFNPNVSSPDVLLVQSFCGLPVSGVPSILLEKADDPDPVTIGSTTTYTVKITNQGTADDANIQVIATIAPELIPIGASEGSINGQTVTLPVLPKLPAKQMITYTIVVKAVKAGEGRSRFDLSSAILKSPIYAEESTTVR